MTAAAPTSRGAITHTHWHVCWLYVNSWFLDEIRRRCTLTSLHVFNEETKGTKEDGGLDGSVNISGPALVADILSRLHVCHQSPAEAVYPYAAGSLDVPRHVAGAVVTRTPPCHFDHTQHGYIHGSIYLCSNTCTHLQRGDWLYKKLTKQLVNRAKEMLLYQCILM